jgi:hypothetical protein
LGLCAEDPLLLFKDTSASKDIVTDLLVSTF